jgi:hypothetical protein
MNCSVKYFLVIIIFLCFPLLAIAGDLEKSEQKINESSVLSLLEGLKSENLGLKTSCAYMLGELKISNAVIPLMKVLRDDENEKARISAALALYKIGSPLSINAIKQARKFDESKRVIKLVSNFYNEYLRNKVRNDDEFIDSTYVSLK